MKKFIMALAFVVVSASPAFAVFTVQDFLDIQSGNCQECKNNFRKYLSGMANGIQYMQIAMRIKVKALPLYCPPQRLALSVDNYFDILEREITTQMISLKNKENGDLDRLLKRLIQSILVLGLQNTFPCEQ